MTYVDLRQLKLAMDARPARVEGELNHIRLARQLWLNSGGNADDHAMNRLAAHNMSCAIGDFLRAIGVSDV
jgi:hypothetical protein